MRGHFTIDLVGKRFGNLVVMSRAANREKRVYWLCKCDCGTVKEVRGQHLRSGKIISCGCLGRLHSMKAKEKHNQTRTRLYGVWQNMKNRCYNKKVRSYKDYGQKGVTVCAEWLHDFNAFSKWAYANGYDPDAEYGKCTIDRIDVCGNYCPENCRFVDMGVQNKNKRKKAG